MKKNISRIEIEIVSEKYVKNELKQVYGVISLPKSNKTPCRFCIKKLGYLYFGFYLVNSCNRRFIFHEFNEEYFDQQDYQNRKMIRWIMINIKEIEKKMS